MSEQAHHPAGAPAHHDHVVPVGVYVAVFLALLALTVLTVAASRLDLGLLNTPVAMGIAVVKAALVVLFFMHLKYSPRLNWLTAAASLLWLFYLIAGTLSDYAARDRVSPQGRPDDVFVLEER